MNQIPSRPDNLGVIIVAGGQGTRLGGSRPKQFQLLAGKPVLQWSCECFAGFPGVHSLVVVLPDQYLAEGRILMTAWHPAVPWQIVAGGRRRQDSVASGLAALATECRWVAIHDAARPGISPDVVARVWAAAREVGAATSGRSIPSLRPKMAC
jgi:2-C-methyl-D-erythritol 4-phosphate cytidylyltransferase